MAKITIPVPAGIGGLALVVSVVFIIVYAEYDQTRQVLRFATLALAAAGGVISAIYIGRGLRQTAESQKIDRTLIFALRWSDPQFFNARRAARDVIQPIMNKSPEDLLAALRKSVAEDPEREHNLTDVLNFLEQLAVAINKEIVDEETLRELYHTVIVRYYSTLEPWINEMRRLRSPRLYQDLEALYDRWKGL